MGYSDIMKSRLVANFKSLGFSVRTILQARKKLPPSKSAFYLFIVLLPLLLVVFVNGPVMALTWAIALFILYPIIDAYAYAVVNGSI
jgi:hypothetical protein